MRLTAEQLEQEVLKLPPEQRACLAERVIASLDEKVQGEWFQLVKPRGYAVVTAPVSGTRTEGDLASLRRLASLCVRPEAALDEFIEAWKKERSGEGNTSNGEDRVPGRAR